jgi:hypothetical protein
MKGAGLKPAATKSVKTDFFTASCALGYRIPPLKGLRTVRRQEKDFSSELLTQDTSLVIAKTFYR